MIREERISMKKVVGFGDFLLRLNPTGYLKFIQANQFEINYTGAEANVCVSLSVMGIETQFVTKLPRNDIAVAGEAMLKKFGVKTDHVVYGGERLGIFYLEKGASQRPSKVIYDRKYTSIATAKREDFDWETILKGAEYFHITGITPALGGELPLICEDACKEAKRQGVTVSCDLNYRKNLWTREQAKATMEKLLSYIDVLIANEEDVENVLGIKARDTDVTAGKLNYDSYIEVAKKLCETYGIKVVGTTLRSSISASDNDWAAMLYTNGKAYLSQTYHIHLVDRVGGGDSFAAGLLYGMVNGFEPQKIIEYAAAASCLKQTIEMDFNLTTADEIEHMISAGGTGRIQR